MEIIIIIELVSCITLGFSGGYFLGKYKTEKEKDEEIKRIKRRIMQKTYD